MEEKIATKNIKQSSHVSKRAVWDCDSALYDSFELKAFEKQLSSAIASRTMSMPHLSDRRLPPPPPPQVNKKPTSKISRSLQRLVRAVFRPKNHYNCNKNNNALFGEGFMGQISKEGFMGQNSKEGFYVVYDKSSGALTTIPEVPEFDGLSPEIRSLLTKTASDRFSVPTSIGISCA